MTISACLFGKDFRWQGGAKVRSILWVAAAWHCEKQFMQICWQYSRRKIELSVRVATDQKRKLLFCERGIVKQKKIIKCLQMIFERNRNHVSWFECQSNPFYSNNFTSFIIKPMQFLQPVFFISFYFLHPIYS